MSNQIRIRAAGPYRSARPGALREPERGQLSVAGRGGGRESCRWGVAVWLPGGTPGRYGRPDRASAATMTRIVVEPPVATAGTDLGRTDVRNRSCEQFRCACVGG